MFGTQNKEMFMSHQVNFKQDSEALDINMESIANELSEMIVGPSSSVAENNWEPSVPYEESARNTKLDGVNIVSVDRRLMNQVMETQGASTIPLHSLNVSKLRSNSIDASAAENKALSHSRRRASAADVEQHQALLCASLDERTPEALYACPHLMRRSGARRKFPRTKPIASIDYDSVVIDLSAIGLNTDNRETNDVLRLFGLFRKLNYYLNDVIPFEAEPDLSDYPKVFIKPTSLMPCTMNVQSQIKHSLHRSNGFCFRLFEKLDEFKLADRDKYIQCSRSLFVLRKMIKQLEPFKTAEFEHKQGIFVNSFGEAQAKNLEILLDQLIGKIRECNIFVDMYLWNIKKHIQRTGLPSMETLKKAVAIAGASIQNENLTLSLENKEEVLTMDSLSSEESNENDSVKGNGGNGGGSVSLATLPLPFINQRPLRFIGV